MYLQKLEFEFITTEIQFNLKFFLGQTLSLLTIKIFSKRRVHVNKVENGQTSVKNFINIYGFISIVTVILLVQGSFFFFFILNVQLFIINFLEGGRCTPNT